MSRFTTKSLFVIYLLILLPISAYSSNIEFIHESIAKHINTPFVAIDIILASNRRKTDIYLSDITREGFTKTKEFKLLKAGIAGGIVSFTDLEEIRSQEFVFNSSRKNKNTITVNFQRSDDDRWYYHSFEQEEGITSIIASLKHYENSMKQIALMPDQDVFFFKDFSPVLKMAFKDDKYHDIKPNKNQKAQHLGLVLDVASKSKMYWVEFDYILPDADSNKTQNGWLISGMKIDKKGNKQKKSTQLKGDSHQNKLTNNNSGFDISHLLDNRRYSANSELDEQYSRPSNKKKTIEIFEADDIVKLRCHHNESKKNIRVAFELKNHNTRLVLRNHVKNLGYLSRYEIYIGASNLLEDNVELGNCKMILDVFYGADSMIVDVSKFTAPIRDVAFGVGKNSHFIDFQY